MFRLAHHFLPREHEVVTWVELCLKFLHIHRLVGHMIRYAEGLVLSSMSWDICRGTQTNKQTKKFLLPSLFLLLLLPALTMNGNCFNCTCERGTVVAMATMVDPLPLALLVIVIITNIIRLWAHVHICTCVSPPPLEGVVTQHDMR